jgi:DNA repair protein RecO
MIVTTEAIVLHSRRYGDTSRIVVLFTRDLGKVSVVARGARTPKSAFGSALEPLTRSRATIYHRRNRDLHTISSAECLTPGAWKNATYEHMRTAMGVCELVLRTQAEESPARDIYDLLSGSLTEIEGVQEDDCYVKGLRFGLHLADAMGFGMSLLPVTEGVAVKLSLDDGIARPESASGIRLSISAYLWLTYAADVATVPVPDPKRVSDADKRELDALMSLYFSYHLDRRVASRVSDTLR